RALLLATLALAVLASSALGDSAEDATCSAQDAAAGNCAAGKTPEPKKKKKRKVKAAKEEKAPASKPPAAAEQKAAELKVAEDGMTADIYQLCPLANTPVSPFVRKTLNMLPRITGTLRMMGLWPAGIYPDNWADEYILANYVIVARIAIGMYKSRNRDYVNIPTEMLDPTDVAHVENVFAPHSDVDGSPNFFWFESIIPDFLKRKLYVPIMTCFYSSFRKLSVENNTLAGHFEDSLNDELKNTWEVVLQDSAFKTKRDWVMAFYDSVHTWDGKPMWPNQTLSRT
ncbi:unnamed protein product, partial [Polarella glacialis]